jgi:hypothetical protein
LNVMFAFENMCLYAFMCVQASVHKLCWVRAAWWMVDMIES